MAAPLSRGLGGLTKPAGSVRRTVAHFRNPRVSFRTPTPLQPSPPRRDPVDLDTYAPLTVAAGSVAQEIANTAPGAKVVKAFNTTFASTLVEGQVAGTPLDVFVASDDDEAKRVVAQLATDGGLRAIDVGPLALAHQLEGAGYLHMAVQPALGTNYGSALKVVA